MKRLSYHSAAESNYVDIFSIRSALKDVFDNKDFSSVKDSPFVGNGWKSYQFEIKDKQSKDSVFVQLSKSKDYGTRIEYFKNGKEGHDIVNSKFTKVHMSYIKDGLKGLIKQLDKKK